VRDIAAISAAVVRCRRCPELRAYTAQVAREKKRAHRDCSYWGKPVPGFGDSDARLVLVGLAPGAHGSNRTGRPSTGAASGDFLYPALFRAGFASAPVARDRFDGLELRDCFITAAARCAPPQNKPTPQELRNCFSFLVEEFEALERLRVAVGLGAIGFNALKLTVAMFDAIFTRAKEILARAGGAGRQSADPAPGSAHPSSNPERLDSSGTQ
jgi:uracil-DNA glycosylase family 4